MLKNEEERRAIARKAGWSWGRHALRDPMPSKFRTALEREEFAAGVKDGEADALKASEEADRQSEAEWNAPPTPPAPPDNSKIVSCRLKNGSISPSLTKPLADLITSLTGKPWGSIQLGSFTRWEVDGGYELQLGEVDARAVGAFCVDLARALEAARQRGRDEGNNLLRRLASGEVTVDAYEDTRDRQRRGV